MVCSTHSQLVRLGLHWCGSFCPYTCCSAMYYVQSMHKPANSLACLLSFFWELGVSGAYCPVSYHCELSLFTKCKLMNSAVQVTEGIKQIGFAKAQRIGCGFMSALFMSNVYLTRDLNPSKLKRKLWISLEEPLVLRRNCIIVNHRLRHSHRWLHSAWFLGAYHSTSWLCRRRNHST